MEFILGINLVIVASGFLAAPVRLTRFAKMLLRPAHHPVEHHIKNRPPFISACYNFLSRQHITPQQRRSATNNWLPATNN
jgi:hypothetical protein